MGRSIFKSPSIYLADTIFSYYKATELCLNFLKLHLEQSKQIQIILSSGNPIINHYFWISYHGNYQFNLLFFWLFLIYRLPFLHMVHLYNHLLLGRDNTFIFWEIPSKYFIWVVPCSSCLVLWVELCLPQKRYVGVLSSTSGCDLIWR